MVTVGPPWFHCSIKDGSVLAVSTFSGFRGNKISEKMKKNNFHVKVNMDWKDINLYYGFLKNPDGTVKHQSKAFVDMDLFFSSGSKTKIMDRKEIIEVNFKLRSTSIFTLRT